LKKSDKIVDLTKKILTSDTINNKLQQLIIIHTSTLAKDFEDRKVCTKAERVELIKNVFRGEDEEREPKSEH